MTLRWLLITQIFKMASTTMQSSISNKKSRHYTSIYFIFGQNFNCQMYRSTEKISKNT